MRTLTELPVFVAGFICFWLLALLLATIWILILGIREKRKVNAIRHVTHVLCLIVLDYYLLQLTADYIFCKDRMVEMGWMTDRYSRIPVVLLLLVYILLTVWEVRTILSILHWYDSHITNGSIKEAIESLPAGVCAYEESGKIVLKNHMMERIYGRLTGGALLNGNEFAAKLKETKFDWAESTVDLRELGIWNFSTEEIKDRKNRFTLITAYNVTEAYQKTRMLSEKQQIVQELNERLTEYNRRIEEVITAREILDAKIRIHDEMGAGLLSIKHYLVSGGTDTEREEMLERLSRNISFLQQEVTPIPQDEYSLMLHTAETLGIAVKINGKLPETEPHKHVLATAMHECITNILRHTDGNALNIKVTEQEETFTAEFTDNNTQPVGEVVPRGGLGSLRTLAEQAGGELRILAAPNFCLTIILSKEIDRNGI